MSRVRHTDEVSVPDGLHAVVADTTESEFVGEFVAIEVERIASEGSASQRHDVHAPANLHESLVVALQVPGVTTNEKKNPNSSDHLWVSEIRSKLFRPHYLIKFIFFKGEWNIAVHVENYNGLFSTVVNFLRQKSNSKSNFNVTWKISTIEESLFKKLQLSLWQSERFRFALIPEQPVAPAHRLCSLKMRVARHDNEFLIVGPSNECFDSFVQSRQHFVYASSEPESRVSYRLIVSTSAGVQFSSRPATDQLLRWTNGCIDIFSSETFYKFILNYTAHSSVSLDLQCLSLCSP